MSIAGIPMTCASLVLSDYVPDIDATIITRILEAGGEITSGPEYGQFRLLGWWSYQRLWPDPQSSIIPDHMAGGSSGGSGAALSYADIDPDYRRETRAAPFAFRPRGAAVVRAQADP